MDANLTILTIADKLPKDALNSVMKSCKMSARKLECLV